MEGVPEVWTPEAVASYHKQMQDLFDEHMLYGTMKGVPVGAIRDVHSLSIGETNGRTSGSSDTARKV